MRPATAAALALVVVVTAGCSSEASLTASSSTLPGAPSTSAAATATSAAGTAAPMDFDLPSDDAEPYPVWDQASREQATTAATAAMTAFARPAPGADPQAWWAALAPLLTPTARDSYALVDPAEVPATQVTGPSVLVEPAPGSTAFLVTVHVPTDAGRYELLLARTGQGAPWLVERLAPPAGLAGPVAAPPPSPAPPP